MTHSAALPRALLDRATLPYRSGGNYAWRFARGKLAGDPAFAAILRRGLIPSGARVLDLGCGQGVLATLLLAAGDLARGTDWPEAWPDPPRRIRLRGIELMPRDVRRARLALAPFGDRARVEQGDIRDADLGHADVVVLLDVLHYLHLDAQQRLLGRVRDCLPPDGRLLLRVGDAGAGWRFQFSRCIDAVVLAARTLPSPRLRLHCRPLAEWRSALERLGFTVESAPMTGKTPFANTLLIARPTKGLV